ncbi:(d)CMP kinase [Nocardioides flavescens]|uniref:Cytidylate kinase n=1 Tax=Nocardioides flavescens TaxID=2691959 RepID=A0A6L7F4F5_9ACTN|nr:(d)CMP kinase [Nocardioides flavescens]
MSRAAEDPTQHPAATGGVVVAVDGTSGSGKSSTSRGVADRLGLRYLDTGAMYRAVTCWMLRHGVDVHDAEAVAARSDEPRLESGTDPLAPTILLDGDDVSTAIRRDDVNAAVSPVSAVPEVRERLTAAMRSLIREAAEGPGIVVEGRDIGSVVWPDAQVKVYLSAAAAARASRRALEEGGSDVEATRASLLARDQIDSGRAVAPLVRADGAVHVDTTGHTLDEVIGIVVGLVRDRAGAPAGRP